MNGIKKGASTQELIQSWLSFSVRSVLGPRVIPSGGTRNQTSAKRSWAPDRVRQVKRPRSRRTGVDFTRQVPLRPRNSQGTNPRTGGGHQPQNWQALFFTGAVYDFFLLTRCSLCFFFSIVFLSYGVLDWGGLSCPSQHQPAVEISTP